MFLFPCNVSADGYPPYWDYSTSAIHFSPVAWPADSSWIPYTYQGVGIKDQRINDPSNGGTSPQNYVNVSSQCTDQSLPSIAWYFDSTKNVLFFRWRVEQIPNTYATGPSPGTYGSTDPWKAAQWTVMIDIDGDGYREFAFHLNGSTGSPSTAVDVVTSIYSNSPTQSIDYIDDPSIYELFHNPSAFVDQSSGRILNFRNMFNPTINWPNGSSETVWDYGTTRSTNISTPTCTEYYIDYQIPLAMLDASSVGGPVVTADTPISLSFITANSLQDPLQKDAVFDGTFVTTPDNCLPFGDAITLNGTTTIPQPVVDWITAEGCDTTTLTAQVRDVISSSCQDTLTSVNFYYYYDKNANNIADDAGSSWTLVGSGTVDASDPSKWTYSGWNTTGLDRGQYLIGVQAKDNPVAGPPVNSNLTFSYLTTAELPAPAPNETNYANPTPTPGIVKAIFNNTCGEYAYATKTVNPSITTVGVDVQFTITITNDTSSSLTITQIDDMLPSGFSYQSTPVEGGTLAGSIATRPLNGATGNITWTFVAGTAIASGGTGTLTFWADPSLEGTFTNNATATTSSPSWPSLVADPVDISVGAPRLTILKTASSYSVMADDTITYTITYSNDSPVNTTSVTITDALPIGMDFVAASYGGTYDSGTHTITWNIGNLPSMDGPYTVSYSVVVTQSAYTKSVNTATIDSAETAPSNATATVFVLSPLKLEKTASVAIVDPAVPDQVTFTMNYTNRGTTALAAVTLTDDILDGFTFVSSALGINCPVGTSDGTTVTWNIGAVAGSASGTCYFTLQVTNPYSGTDNPAINTATITATGIGPVTASAQVGITEGDCSGSPTIYYFKDLDASDYPDPIGLPAISADSQFFANTTAPTSSTAKTISAVAQVGIEDEFLHFYQDPPQAQTTGFSFVGTIDTTLYITKGPQKIIVTAYLYDYDPATGDVTQIGTLASATGPGNRTNWPMTFNIAPTGVISQGNLLLWRFTITGDGSSSENITGLFDGTSSQSNSAVCFAPLSIVLTKQADKLTIVDGPGNTLQYTIVFSNTGSGTPFTGAQIVDTLPSGVTYVSATLNGVAASPLEATPCTTCTFDVRSSDLPPWGEITGGQSGTLVINVNVGNPLLPGISNLTNTAELTTDDTDPIYATAVTTVTPPTPLPDIVMLKTADKTLLYPGDIVTYTIKVINAGDASSSTINVTDVIPADAYFTYVAGSIAGGTSRSDALNPTLTWTINTLAMGATTDLIFQMQVAGAGVPAGFYKKDNKATATEATPTTVPDSNTVSVTYTTNANIQITKSVSLPAPYSQSVGTGANTLSNVPIHPGRLQVLEGGTLIGTDSGTGYIIGGNLKNSTIDYSTGDLYLEFITPPAGALTASYISPVSTGDTLEYTITVSSVGGSTATNVLVNDSIPANMIYNPGTLIYEGSSQTDIDDYPGTDNSHYDSFNDRAVFQIGDLAKGLTRTMKFRTTIDSTLPYGTSTLTNTAYASADNTATKESSTTLNISAAPELTISKSAPAMLPYPLTTVTVGGVGVFTITVANIQYISVGDVISVLGTATTVTAINTTTRVLTLDTAVTAGAGTQVLPTMKFNLYYANTGNTDATNVTISDLLQSGLIFISADSGGTYDAPTTTVSWNIGTVAAGETGKVSVRVRPPGTGTYNNSGKLRSTELATVDSNTTTTVVGAVELSKTTSTPAVVNGAGGTTASYTLLLKNQLSVTGTGVYVTDPLPTGFTYTSTGGITGGLCQYTPRSKVIGTTAGTYYIAKVNHIADATNRPTTGANWATYWDVSVIGGALAWINGFHYSTPNQPTWNNCTINIGATLTIPFNVAIAPTVGAGTYQNPATATSTNMSVLPFDELNTTAEDVTVSMPADLKVAKTVTLTPGCGVQVGCAITYDITVTNVGTATATAFTINDVLPASVTYTGVPPYTATEGTWNGTNWTAGPVNITATSSVVTGTDGMAYTCIKRHVAAAANRPITGASWQTYWVLGGSNPVAWVSGTTYSSATAKLTIPATINSVAGTITNTALRTASTFTSGTDTNSSNDSSSVSIMPTSITLSGFGAYENNGNVVVEWETSSEVNTVGFFVSRMDETSGKFLQLNSRLLPSVLTPPIGGSYSLIDEGAVPGKTYTYLLTEAEVNGTINTYGPFIVTVNKSRQDRKSLSVTGSSFTASGITGDAGTDLFASYTRKPHEMSEKKKVRLKLSKELRKAFKKQKKQLSGLMIKIPVTKDGLYFFDASRISELMGISYDLVKYFISTNNIALSSQGNDVSYLSASDSSGIFFYGLHTGSIYTKENIYWLYNGNGTSMQYTYDEGPEPVEQTTFLETVHAEEDKLIGTYPFLDPEADFWFWNQIYSGYPAYDTKTFTVRTDGVADMTSNAKLTVNLQGITDTAADPDHHVTVSINGTPVGEYSWDGTEAPSPSFEFSQQLLNNGDNTLQLKGLLDTGVKWSLFYIDSLDLSYQRLYEAKENSLVLKSEGHPSITVYGFNVPDIFVFDITDPNNPSVKTSPAIDETGDGYSVSFVPSPDSTYLAATADTSMIVEDAWADSPSDLMNKRNNAEYIIIAPDELIDSAQYLADYRRKNGLKPMIVNIEDIMDEFNYGLSSPKAIRSFLTYAYYNWKKAPKYVILIGDSTYDYRDNLGYGENLVPTMVVSTPMGLFTSDNILADVNSDHVPEIAIGRLPVLSSEELRDVTDKIIAFERNADNRILMLADNADSGGDFPADSDELALSFPSVYKTRKIYLSEYPVNEARLMLFDKINIGTSIINYFGHAGATNLASENLLNINDVESFSNINRPFIMNAMTCMVGQYAFPGGDTLSETLILKKDGGAVAVWAPSGLAFHFDSKALDEFFFTTALMKNKRVLGSSILSSCRSFYNSGGPSYILDIYNLQGDPALKLW